MANTREQIQSCRDELANLKSSMVDKLLYGQLQRKILALEERVCAMPSALLDEVSELKDLEDEILGDDSEEEIAAFKMDSQTIVTQSELQLEQTTLRQPEQQSDQSTTSSIPKKQQIHNIKKH